MEVARILRRGRLLPSGPGVTYRAGGSPAATLWTR